MYFLLRSLSVVQAATGRLGPVSLTTFISWSFCFKQFLHTAPFLRRRCYLGLYDHEICYHHNCLKFFWVLFLFSDTIHIYLFRNVCTWWQFHSWSINSLFLEKRFPFIQGRGKRIRPAAVIRYTYIFFHGKYNITHLQNNNKIIHDA